MLPFVVGGGILIAIAFLIDGFSVDLNSLPAEDVYKRQGVDRGEIPIEPGDSWFSSK